MEQHSSPFLMSSDHVSRRHQWFTCVHLLISHLTQSSCAFSVTLTTPALYRRSLRWFDGCFQKPPPEGLPPSQLQLRADRLCSRVTPVSPWQDFLLTRQIGNVEVISRQLLNVYPKSASSQAVIDDVANAVDLTGKINSPPCPVKLTT